MSAGLRLVRRWLRRPWLVFVALFLGLAGVDAWVRWHDDFWHACDSHPYRDRFNTLRRQSWDLVIVGGSPAMCGLDPNVLAGAYWRGNKLERVFNAGMPMGTTADAYHCVVNGLKAPPKLLIYGITASDLNDDRKTCEGPAHLMSAGEIVAESARWPRLTWWHARYYASERLARVWRLYYHRNALRLWAAESFNGLWPGPFADSAAEARQNRAVAAERALHGFLAPMAATPEGRLDYQKAAGTAATTFEALDRYRLGRYSTHLEWLIDWAEQHEAPLVLVDVPVPAELEDKMFPAAFAVYRAHLAEVERRRDVRVLRPTRATLGLTDADFSDLVHLNSAGTAEVSAWVRRQLEAHGSGDGRP